MITMSNTESVAGTATDCEESNQDNWTDHQTSSVIDLRRTYRPPQLPEATGDFCAFFLHKK